MDGSLTARKQHMNRCQLVLTARRGKPATVAEDCQRDKRHNTICYNIIMQHTFLITKRSHFHQTKARNHTPATCVIRRNDTATTK